VLSDSESAANSRSEVRFRHFGCLPQKTENGGFWGRVEFTGTHVVLAVGKNPQHGETRLGGAYEIAIGEAERRHNTEHRGGPVIVTSHNGRYLVLHMYVCPADENSCDPRAYCPPQCKCSGTEVRCSHQQLNALPELLPLDTTELYVQRHLVKYFYTNYTAAQPVGRRTALSSPQL